MAKTGLLEKVRRRLAGRNAIPDKGEKVPTTLMDPTFAYFQGAMGWQELSEESGRKARYDRYDKMCTAQPLIHAALNIRATLPILTDRAGEASIWVESSNNRVVDLLGMMIERTKLPLYSKELLYWVKRHGFRPMETEFSDYQIEGFVFHDPHTIRALVDKTGHKVVGWEKLTDSGIRLGDPISANVFEPWRMIGFTQSLTKIYGESDLKYMKQRIRINQWQALALMLGRVFRSIDAREHLVDVSDCKTEKERMIRIARKRRENNTLEKYISDGQLNMQGGFNPMPQDIYSEVTANGAQNVGVKPIPGQKGLDTVEDIELIREEALSVLHVPLRILGVGKDTLARAELSEQDVNLARMAILDQEWLKTFVLYPLCNMELALAGMDPTRSKYSYKIRMVDLDTGAKLQEQKIAKMQAQLFQILAKTEMWSPEVLMRNIYRMTDQEIAENWRSLEQWAEMRKMLAQMSQLDQQEQDPNAPEGGGNEPPNQQ